jgi:nicotinamidase-related amidase
MTAPQRALIVIDAQQEYFDGLLPIQYPARDQSITSVQAAIKAAEQTGTPVVLVQHELPAEAPVFGSGSATWQNHPEVAAHEDAAAKRVGKQFSSIFADTDLEAWLREQGIDTITLAGYMTNNCVIASAAAAEPLGFTVEVLRTTPAPRPHARSTRPLWRCCIQTGPPSPTPRPGPKHCIRARH